MSKPNFNPLITARSVAINRKEPFKVDAQRASIARQLRTIHPGRGTLGSVVARALGKVQR